MNFPLNFLLATKLNAFIGVPFLRKLQGQLLKCILFFCLVVSLGSYSFKSLASVCNCEKIRKTGECSNPNCVQICGFQLPLNEINQALIKKCLGKKSWTYHSKKPDVPASEVKALITSAEKSIEGIHSKGEASVEKNCPNCEIIPKISADFKVNPLEENCPQQYLKTYKYNHNKKFELKKGMCNKDKIFQYSGKYVEKVVNSPQTNPESKKLWEACPDPCSFQINYSVKIDEKNCKGEIDLKVDCTHRGKRKGLFQLPIYDVKVSYTGDLKCEGK